MHSLKLIFSSCGRVCGIKFYWLQEENIETEKKMSCEIVFMLGESTRVTLSSRVVARLKRLSGLIRFMLSPDLRSRWSLPTNFLYFPENILSKEHLLIVAGKWKIRKETVNLYEFVRTLHYLEFDEVIALHLLRLQCSKCCRNNWDCSYHHIQDNGWYYNYDFIPVWYFLHYLANWQEMYNALLEFLRLRDISIDETWPYHKFKKYIRAMLRSRSRWLDDRHFRLGEFRRLGCYARGCKLCEPDPPAENGDGWR